MTIWILLTVLLYLVSWCWLFSRIKKHAARAPQELQQTPFEEAV